MLHLGVGHETADGCVAAQTERTGFLDQQFGLLGIMRIVATDAVHARSNMAILPRHDFAEIIMTIQTERVHLLDDRSGIGPILVLVAQAAIAILIGAMGGYRFLQVRNRIQIVFAHFGHRHGFVFFGVSRRYHVTAGQQLQTHDGRTDSAAAQTLEMVPRDAFPAVI